MNSHLTDAVEYMLAHLHIHPTSVVRQGDVVYGLDEAVPGKRQLAVIAPAGTAILQEFTGEAKTIHEQTVLLGPLSAHNAAALRRQIAWLNPVVFGLATSAGFGDRLGLATSGHLQAVRAAGGHIAPIPAQQSIREMTRTGRSPQQVMDDAMWGVFAEGWRSGFGADADHLKTPADIDSCLVVGYTFYTFDPGEHVDNSADTADIAALRAAFDTLPWDRLADTPADLSTRYLIDPQDFEGHTIAFDEESLLRAAVKYGRAIAHVAHMYHHLAEAGAGRPWEVEISVDETETPTTHAEHVYFATELRRLGVQWVSLAPRYIGRFEKGVDYIGDLDAFTADFAVHAAIARTLGPYKLSLHSGSDKFSIYEIAARETRGVMHLKTAGTSYLEALRTVGQIAPDLLREIYAFAYDHYETDRASYHVSAQLDRAAAPDATWDKAATDLLEQFDAREILHVTFGSVLTYTDMHGTKIYYDQIMALLQTHPEAYAANLKAHFLHHLQPFVAYSQRQLCHCSSLRAGFSVRFVAERISPAMTLASRPLGATGFQVTSLCIGCSALGNMPETFAYSVAEELALATIRALFASSINFADTAAAYGDGESERRIGIVLRELGGIPSSFVLATKADRNLQTGEFTGVQMRRSVERSLRLLGLEQLPICFLHDPEHIGFAAAMAPGGPVAILQQCQAEGLIGHLGIAGGPIDMLTQFVETGLFALAISHNRFTLLNQEADMFWDICARYGVAALNAAPYGSGMLAKGPNAYPRYMYDHASDQYMRRAMAMEAICQRYQVPLAAVALQFSLRDPRIVSTIVGISKPERLEETVHFAQMPLPAAIWRDIAAVQEREDV